MSFIWPVRFVSRSPGIGPARLRVQETQEELPRSINWPLF